MTNPTPLDELLRDCRSATRKKVLEITLAKPEDFPDAPVPECHDCGDIGRIEFHVDGEPEHSMRLRPCPCVKRKNYSNVLRQLDLENARFRGLTLTTYEPENEAQEKALEICAAWAEAWPAVERGILLQGPVGVGKTGLLWATAKAAGAKLCELPYILRAQDLGDAPVYRISGEYDVPTRSEIIERFRHRRLLVFDDLGTGKRTESSDGSYFRLLDKRHLACIPTLVTTNYIEKTVQTADGHTIESFRSRVGSRLYSRLQQSCDFYDITGDDRRSKKAEKGAKP